MAQARTPYTRNAEERLEFYRIEQRYSTARTLIRAAAWVGAAYFLQQIARDLAGGMTALKLEIDILADIKFAVTLALAGSAAAWAVVERVLRQRKVESLQGRIAELETAIDPGRTSSGLTTKGKTNPADRGQ